MFDDLHADGRTIIVITHEHDVAARARRLIHVSDGRIDSDEVTR
jgi:putative ABC transport system ATP-binding protein